MNSKFHTKKPAAVLPDPTNHKPRWISIFLVCAHPYSRWWTFINIYFHPFLLHYFMYLLFCFIAFFYKSQWAMQYINKSSYRCSSELKNIYLRLDQVLNVSIPVKRNQNMCLLILQLCKYLWMADLQTLEFCIFHPHRIGRQHTAPKTNCPTKQERVRISTTLSPQSYQASSSLISSLIFFL